MRFFLGPVVDTVKSEASKTSGELRDLKNSRVTPSTTTNNGQLLTRMCWLDRTKIQGDGGRKKLIEMQTTTPCCIAC
jgi:hypothetical protein